MNVVRIHSTGQLASQSYPGLNKPVRGVDDDGLTRVFKSNGIAGMDIANREADVAEIVGSHIVHDTFGLPGLVVQEAILDGGREGICTAFVEGLQTLETVPVQAIHNPDQAVAQSVVRAWLGDMDFGNSSNVWLTADGQAMAASDLGFAFQEGISDEGKPRANLSIVSNLANVSNTQPTVDKICAFSDEKIRHLVDDIGKANVKDWTDATSQKLSDVLLHNRDEFRIANPFRS